MSCISFCSACYPPFEQDFLSDSYPPLDSLCRQPETGLTEVPGSEGVFRTS